MKIYHDPLGVDEPPRGTVMSIGNFDGVHLGHQAVLRHVVERARVFGTRSVAMTLDPHPIKVLRPQEAPALLTTLSQRLELIADTGIEVCLVVPFTRELARMEAVDFVRDVLVDRLAVREVYIGKNFRFGADRGGDVDLLVRQGQELGFEAGSSPIVEVDGEVASSSRVREAVAQGLVDRARQLLGRPVFADGSVAVGKRLGRKLGFPTLNIVVENELHPSHGVYVTAVHIPSFASTFPAVTNVGVRPTLYEDSVTTIESHLLEFTADMYEERVRLYFLHRLRDEQSFATAAQLMAQIRRDVQTAKDWVARHPLADMKLILPRSFSR
jgi:riboflavin kinase/FMN adenylyltransferase